MKYFQRLLMLILLCIMFLGCSGTKDDESLFSITTPTIDLAQDDSAEAEEDPFIEKRMAMVEEDIRARGVSDPNILQAMRSIPRDKFVPDEYIDLAYSDRPLPIGYGQTISQPYIVAWMTQLLDLSEGEKVLEIGTGSGYQAAVLAELGNIEVYSIEIIPELAENAQKRLTSLGYDDIHLMEADGYFGWEEHKPFDAIIVTAAPDHLPQPLVNQLADGGKLVIPIGPQGAVQTLWVFENNDGNLTARNMGLVTFVPFTGSGIGAGYPAP